MECVIDNKDALSDRYFQVISGSWGENAGPSDTWDPSDPNRTYHWARTTSGAETARAEWACTSLPAGQYDVFARWPTLPYAMGNTVAYEVHHAGGVTTVRVNQNQNTGQWNSLGVYSFNAGSHVVQIHNGQSAPSWVVCADAIKFSPAP